MLVSGQVCPGSQAKVNSAQESGSLGAAARENFSSRKVTRFLKKAGFCDIVRESDSNTVSTDVCSNKALVKKAQPSFLCRASLHP